MAILSGFPTQHLIIPASHVRVGWRLQPFMRTVATRFIQAMGISHLTPSYYYQNILDCHQETDIYRWDASDRYDSTLPADGSGPAAPRSTSLGDGSSFLQWRMATIPTRQHVQQDITRTE